MPASVITQIEQAVYSFFWSAKHTLVNRDIFTFLQRMMVLVLHEFNLKCMLSG